MKPAFRLILLLLWSLAALPCQGQETGKKFYAALKASDTTTCQQLLAQWKAEGPDDPERYCAAFNYFATFSKREILRLDSKPGPDGEQMVIKEQGKKGKTAGYIYGDKYYDADMLDQGLAYIDTGITKFPQRLDMRFGKIYILGQAKDFDNYTAEILRAIDDGARNQYDWKWTNNEPRKDAKNFVLSCIQDYVVTLFNTEEDHVIAHIGPISERVLHHEPDHVPSLSNLSIYHLYREEYDQAIAALTKAHTLVPDDYIVVNNLANCYRLKGDKKNAIHWYKVMEASKDEEIRQAAKEKLKELK